MSSKKTKTRKPGPYALYHKSGRLLESNWGETYGARWSELDAIMGCMTLLGGREFVADLRVVKIATGRVVGKRGDFMGVHTGARKKTRERTKEETEALRLPPLG